MTLYLFMMWFCLTVTYFFPHLRKIVSSLLEVFCVVFQCCSEVAYVMAVFILEIVFTITEIYKAMGS